MENFLKLWPAESFFLFLNMKVQPAHGFEFDMPALVHKLNKALLVSRSYFNVMAVNVIQILGMKIKHSFTLCSNLHSSVFANFIRIL